MLRKVAALLSLTVCLAWTDTASAQVIGSGIYGDTKTGYTCTASANFLTRSDTVAAIAAVPSGQSTELANWKADIQTLICNGTTNGWLPLDDVFYEFAAPSPTLALLNLGALGASYDATLTNTGSPQLSLMFSPEVGFTQAKNVWGPASAVNYPYLNTGYNPGLGSGGPYQLTTNSTSFGICDLNYRYAGVTTLSFQVSSEVEGGSASISVERVGESQSGNSLATLYAANAGSSGTSSFNTLGAQGQWLTDRSASNLTSEYRNDTAFGTVATASVALASSTFILGASNLTGTIANAQGADTFANFGAGASLGTTAGAAIVAAYFADIHAYNIKRGIFGC